MEYIAPSWDQAWSYLGAFVRSLKKKNRPQVGPNCVDFLLALSEYWIERSAKEIERKAVTTCEQHQMIEKVLYQTKTIQIMTYLPSQSLRQAGEIITCLRCCNCGRQAHEDLQKFRLQLLEDLTRIMSGTVQPQSNEGVAEKFGSEKDAGYLSWHTTKFADQEYPAAPKDWRTDVLQVSGYFKVVGRQ